MPKKPGVLLRWEGDNMPRSTTVMINQPPDPSHRFLGDSTMSPRRAKLVTIDVDDQGHACVAEEVWEQLLEARSAGHPHGFQRAGTVNHPPPIMLGTRGADPRQFEGFVGSQRIPFVLLDRSDDVVQQAPFADKLVARAQPRSA